MPRRQPFACLALGALVLAACNDGSIPSQPEPDRLPTKVSRGTGAGMTAAPAFRQVSAGEIHTCGVTSGGVAYCWGSNDAGALGNGTTHGSLTPVPVAGGLSFREVNASSFRTCGVTMNERLFCWGHNQTGQLGDGTQTDRRHPVRIGRGLVFRQVSSGDLHTCGVTTTGVAYCWGHNQAGELGDGTTEDALTPVRVRGKLVFRQVSAGNQFTCGVTTSNAAYCWGMNPYGQLGNGNDTGPESCFTGDGNSPCSTKPVRVVRGLAFDHVSAGLDYVCGVTMDHVGWCWGANSAGQLGHHTSTGPELCFGIAPCSTKPIRVAGRLAFRSVSADASHTCSVTTGSVAYCWGSNWSGELGVGSGTGPETCDQQGFIFPCSTRPVRVAGELAFRAVDAGDAHTCGVRANGVAFCWGENSSGQLGDGTTQRRLRPRRVAGSE